MSGVPEDSRAAARGTVALAAVQTAARACGFVFVFVATRELAPSLYGRYSVVAALVLIGSSLADFGTTPVITRRVSQDSDESHVLLTGTLVLSGALGTLAYGGTLAFVALADYPSPTMMDMVVGGAALPLDAVLTSILGALDGRGLIARRSVVSFGRVAVTTLGGAGALLAGFGVRQALAAMPIGSLFGLLLAVGVARRQEVWTPRFRVDVKRSMELLRSAVPYAVLGGLQVIILRFDVVALSILGTSAETAEYDVAARVIDALAFLGTALAAPSLFLLSRRLGQQDVSGAERGFAEAVRLTYVTGLGAAAMTAALAGPAVDLLFGSGFHDAGAPLAILGAALWLFFLTGVQGSLILAAGQASAALRVALLNTALLVVLDIALIVPFGTVGTAAAMAFSQLLAAWLFSAFIRQRIGIRTPWPPAAMVVAAVIAALVMGWMGRWSVPLALPAGAVVYLGGLALFGELRRSDLARLLRVLR